MDTLDKGTYLEVDGRPAVRFVRLYPHDVDRVWRAVTDPAELKHWFPSPEVRYEARVGGSIELSGDPYAPESKTTKVLAFEPPHRFGFEWGEDELDFTLTATGDGCRLELLNILAGSGEAARNAAGWEVCLEELRKTIYGTPGSESNSSSLEWQPLLDGYLAQGFPDDGWRPDA
jgi:uncharacterized protein YndB with AHSA1/START domain